MLSKAAYKKRLETTRRWKKAHPGYEKTYYEKNKVKRLAESKAYVERNKDKVSARRKKFYYNNINLLRGQKRKYYYENKESVLARLRVRRQDPEIKARRKLYKDEYYRKNKKTLAVKQKEYTARPEVRARRNANKVARRLSDPHYRLRLAISSGVRIRLKNRGKRKDAPLDKILPFKFEDLITRLESLFKPGMTWANYGEWHVDHIKADAKFNYTSVHDPGFAQSWAITNLQPLWASENCSKGSK